MTASPRHRPLSDRSPRARRFAEATALVAVLVAIGVIFQPSLNVYVLLTLPATVLFQLVVRRRPLRELWVRDGPRIERHTMSWLLALALMILPIITLVRSWRQVDLVLYCLSAVGGAIAPTRSDRATHAPCAISGCAWHRGRDRPRL